jgi:hypothetical protein
MPLISTERINYIARVHSLHATRAFGGINYKLNNNDYKEQFTNNKHKLYSHATVT